MSEVRLGCEQCGATLVVRNQRTTVCPYCASPSVVERPPTTGQPDPVFVLTFAEGTSAAAKALKAWTSAQSIFCDGALKHAKVEDLQGIYMPAALYSAVARAQYQAEIGEDYTEIETYTVTDSEGNTRTETRTVTRTEYRHLSGEHVGYITDVIVSASKGLPNDELEAVEPFDLRQLRRYHPGLISGWNTEDMSRSFDECVALARGEAIALEGQRLTAFMPGDSHRDLTYAMNIDWETIDPVLVPIWVLAVRYRTDKPPLRVVVNGQTGKATGKAPISPIRVVIGIAVAIAAIVGLVVAIKGGR